MALANLASDRLPSSPVSALAAGAFSDPNGLAWDPVAGELHIAEHGSGHVVSWTEVSGLGRRVAVTEHGGLGQPAIGPDGALVVALFGEGAPGGMARIDPRTGALHRLPGLNPWRRRIGLAVGDEALFVACFTGGKEGRRGAVARVGFKGGERDIMTGLVKPVGLAIAGGFLYVADQGLGLVLRAPVDRPHEAIVIAAIEGADALCSGPNGNGAFVATQRGAVFLLDPSGRLELLPRTFFSPRGLAWDDDRRRLFVSERGHQGMSSVVILQLED